MGVLPQSMTELIAPLEVCRADRERREALLSSEVTAFGENGRESETRYGCPASKALTSRSIFSGASLDA
jgi:hypothetical protein